MTREQLQQVRDRVEKGKHDCACDFQGDSCRECDADNAALAILDSELAKPEDREWRILFVSGEDAMFPGEDSIDGPFDSEDQAREVLDFAKKNSQLFTHVKLEMRVCGTPAGPWEAA